MQAWKGEFETWLEKQGRSELTITAYSSDVELYGRWFLAYAEEAFEPSLLTGMALRAWREYSLEVERVAASTWNRRRASIRVFCTWALAAKYVSVDPFQMVDAAAVKAPPIKWIDDNEFNRVDRELARQVNTAKSEPQRRQAIRNRAIVALMLFGGLRDGEVVNVWREDLLLTARTGAVRVRAGKGDTYTDEDGTDIHYEGTIWIKDWLALRGDEQGPIFGGKGSEQLTTRQIQRFVHDLGVACGIAGLTPHWFRHTFIKRTLDGKYRRDGRPVPLNYVQVLARHARIATTARYALPGRKDLQEAVGA